MTNPFSKTALRFALMLAINAPAYLKAESTVRIRAGAGAFTDGQGNVWAADNYFNTGSTYLTTSAIAGTANPALYQGERYDLAGGSELTYSIPVTPGSYRVRLHFAEIYFTAANQRVFDVMIGNQLAFANLDVFAQAGGKDRALIKEFDVTVAGSTLAITFNRKIENPKISSIEIVPGNSAPPVTDPDPPTNPPVTAGCIDGKWDPFYNWVKDCTPGNQYDGKFPAGPATATFTGSTQIFAGTTARTLSWKLHYFKSNVSGAISGSQLPLVVGLHPWSDGTTVPNLLNIESNLMQFEGNWEDVLFLTVALENGNNLNTWWDGSKVNGVPTTWAMDGIVALVKARIGDATSLLGSAGASGLSSKTVDPNRVYLSGPSMGGTGAYHIGIRHPELFAALHAKAGFADYDGGPCGTEAFCTSFTNDFIGTVAQNLQMKGLDGKDYPARSYSNMSWFAGVHNGASWTASLGNGRKYEPPYVLMTHGKVDDAVHISSANRLFDVLRAKKYGYTYLRHPSGHSGENFIHLDWLLSFRKNQSFLAFTNNSTDVTSGTEQYNFLNKIGWIPSSIKDQAQSYEVTLAGSGTVDITPRRLQAFVVQAGAQYRYWMNAVTGAGTAVTAGSDGTLTIPSVTVNGTATLIIRPDGAVPPPPTAPKITVSPASLAFGSVPLAQTSTLNLTVTNTGTANLTVSALTLGGSQAAQFGFTATPPLTLAPSASAAIPVRYTPSASGSAAATLALASNDPATPSLAVSLSGSGQQSSPAALTVSQASLSFGSVALGSVSAPANLVLTNSGGSPLVVSALTLSGAQAAEFSLTAPALPLTLAPAASATVPVRFTPAATGARAASIAIVSNQTAGTVNVPLSGTGTTVAASTVRIRAGAGAFTDGQGNVWAADNYFNTGSTYTTTAPITGTVNPALYQSERYDLAGGSELTYSIPVTPGAYKVRLHFAEIYFTAANQRVFDVMVGNQLAFANLDVFVQAGGKDKALIKEFDVTVAGSTLAITFNRKIENPKISSIEILPADGGTSPTPPAPAALAVSPASLGFGSVAVGSVSGPANLVLTNSGGSPLVVSALTLSGAQAAEFSLTAPALPLTLAPAAASTIPVRFTPAASGARAASIAIVSNQTAGTVNVPLSGTGTATPPPPPPPTAATIRVRAGGGAFTDGQGNAWAADNYFNTGSTYTTTAPITGTLNQVLYQSERYDLPGGSNLAYSIPVSPGFYKVRLHFAETYVNGPGQRVFDVLVEDQVAFPNLDVFAQAGAKNKALVLDYDVTVSDAVLTVSFLHKIENPKICGIEILPAEGGHVHPFLHVVIESDSLAVDYDGDGMETMHFNGSPSHTHELGKLLVSRKWELNGSALADATAIDIDVPVGDHDVGLTIADDNSPQQTLSSHKKVTVARGDLIPGGLALYYPSASPSGLLDAPPAQPARAAVLPVLTQTIAAAPLAAPYLAIFEARILLAAAGQYTFAATGGSGTRLFVNGSPVNGPVNVAAGLVDLEARFAVSAQNAAPLQVTYSLGVSAPAPIPASLTFRDETYLPPVVNTFTAQGSAEGFPVDIAGMGFFPRNQVQVFVGQSVFQGSSLQGNSTSLRFTAPPGIGQVQGYVSTPNGNSLPFTLTYNGGPSTNIVFNTTQLATMPSPTQAVWGPDGRLYVTSLAGVIIAYTLNDNYQITAQQTINTIAALSNKEIMGIAFNPYETSGPVKMYVAHSLLHANGGGCFSGPSEYNGQISVLTGPDFAVAQPLITGLPTSNHDHGVSGMEFDNNGDLLLTGPGGTNAGLPNCALGAVTESPLSAAILKAHLSKAGFNGKITYLLTATGNPSSDQVQGGVVDVAPGTDISVVASGVRNSYDLTLTTWNRIFATDNGPNAGYGAASTSATTEGPHPQTEDELLLIEQGAYYGHPNRNRGRTDARQNVYRNVTEPGIPGVFNQAKLIVPASTNGIVEYRAQNFGGAMRGNLLLQKWNGDTYRVAMAADGQNVAESKTLPVVLEGLDIATGPGGVLISADYTDNSVMLATPVNAGSGLDAYDIFPWRAPSAGGAKFEIGGRGFGNLGNTTVTIGGAQAVLTSVSPTRIRGVIPAKASSATGLQDVVVTMNGASRTIPKAFLYLTR